MIRNIGNRYSQKEIKLSRPLFHLQKSTGVTLRTEQSNMLKGVTAHDVSIMNDDQIHPSKTIYMGPNGLTLYPMSEKLLLLMKYSHDPNNLIFCLPKGLLLPEELICCRDYKGKFSLQPRVPMLEHELSYQYNRFFEDIRFVSRDVFLKGYFSYQDLSFLAMAPKKSDFFKVGEKRPSEEALQSVIWTQKVKNQIKKRDQLQSPSQSFNAINKTNIISDHKFDRNRNSIRGNNLKRGVQSKDDIDIDDDEHDSLDDYRDDALTDSFHSSNKNTDNYNKKYGSVDEDRSTSFRKARNPSFSSSSTSHHSKNNHRSSDNHHLGRFDDVDIVARKIPSSTSSQSSSSSSISSFPSYPSVSQASHQPTRYNVYEKYRTYDQRQDDCFEKVVDLDPRNNTSYPSVSRSSRSMSQNYGNKEYDNGLFEANDNYQSPSVRRGRGRKTRRKMI